VLADSLLDTNTEIEGGAKRPFPAHQAASHFIDGANGGNRDAAFDGFDHAVMVVNVNLVPGLNENEIGAHAFCFGDDRAGTDAEGLGLVAGSDADSGIGHHGDDCNRLAAQLGTHLLLDRSEVGVEVDKEPIDVRSGERLLADIRRGFSEVRQLSHPWLSRGNLNRYGCAAHLKIRLPCTD